MSNQDKESNVIISDNGQDNLTKEELDFLLKDIRKELEDEKE